MLFFAEMQHGPVYKLAFGPKAFVVVSDPIVARHILRENAFAYDKVFLCFLQLQSLSCNHELYIISDLVVLLLQRSPSSAIKYYVLMSSRFDLLVGCLRALAGSSSRHSGANYGEGTYSC